MAGRHSVPIRFNACFASSEPKSVAQVDCSPTEHTSRTSDDDVHNQLCPRIQGSPSSVEFREVVAGAELQNFAGPLSAERLGFTPVAKPGLD